MSDSTYSVEFTFVDERGHASKHVLTTGQFLLGRSEECDICFPETAITVSRKHARVSISPEEVVVEDLDSRTGTMVNGRFVRRHVIEPGDGITIGPYTLTPDLPEQRRAGRSAVVVSSEDRLERDSESLELELHEVRTVTEELLKEMAKRIIGQQDILRSVWAAILTKEHCLMVGVPGLAKTLMVTTFAEALGLTTTRIQFTPDLMPSDIIGSNVIQESDDGKRQFEFVQGPIFTQLLLADEINRTPPKTQSALLEAMQERQVTVGNRSLLLPSPFCVIATQNPIEQEGTYPLPEAQQDRFMVCVVLDYPNRDEEIDILIRTTQGVKTTIDQVVTHAQILTFQKVVQQIAVGEELAAYAADVVRATRPNQPESKPWITDLVDWGAGPRAGQSLLRGAKALAAMDGRPAIARDDILEMAHPVIRHRIAPNYRARTQGMDEEGIITRLLEEVSAR